MVAPATNRSSPEGSSAGNNSVWVRMITKTPTFVSSPAKIAVTGVGAVGYESGNHMNSGNNAALMPNTTSINRLSVRLAAGSTSVSRSERSARFMVPLIP